ncbi:hypothetical protein [Nonomuraea aurantiaca]|nr:hypothetical protein [Nonomuraea aurantiaca]
MAVAVIHLSNLVVTELPPREIYDKDRRPGTFITPMNTGNNEI